MPGFARRSRKLQCAASRNPARLAKKGTMNGIADLARAYQFAAVRHLGQKRKGKAGEPYINHLTEVADLVAEATAGRDPELVVAAVLHDILEDTQTTPEEVAREFGQRVALLVAEVSDDKSLPKEERKRLQIEHARALSPGAKHIKLADKTANLRSLCKSPPADWPPERIVDYAEWAVAVVAGCRGANAFLERRFQEALAALGNVANSE
jgi:(p)ppGpp synthase/HD superfamily hydrolase